MVVLKKRFSASGIVEIVVALVILMAVYGVGITFLTAIHRAGFNVFKANAVGRLEAYAAQTIRNKEFYEETARWQPNMLVSRKITVPEGKGNLLLLLFSVKEPESGLFLTKEVLVVNE